MKISYVDALNLTYIIPSPVAGFEAVGPTGEIKTFADEKRARSWIAAECKEYCRIMNGVRIRQK